MIKIVLSSHGSYTAAWNVDTNDKGTHEDDAGMCRRREAGEQGEKNQEMTDETQGEPRRNEEEAGDE